MTTNFRYGQSIFMQKFSKKKELEKIKKHKK